MLLSLLVILVIFKPGDEVRGGCWRCHIASSGANRNSTKKEYCEKARSASDWVCARV